MESKKQKSEKFTLELNTPYEFTYCPNDSTQHGNCKLAVHRKLKCYNDVKEIFSRSKIEYVLFAEISEPQYGDGYKNSLARIHWHGIIKITNAEALIDYLLSTYTLLTNCGRLQLNPLRDEWLTYIVKNRHKYKSLRINIKNVSLKTILRINNNLKKRESEHVAESPKEFSDAFTSHPSEENNNPSFNSLYI